MQKTYVKPNCVTLESLAFETVCAGSGKNECIINPGVRDSIVIGKYNPCQSCFQMYYAGYSDTVNAMPGGNVAANREQAIRNILSAGGACPGGFTTIS